MNALDQLQLIFDADGFDFEREHGQFAFRASCGPFDSFVRIYANGFLLTLILETGFCVPEDRRSAMAEFCTAANYALMAFANLEMNPADGQLILRNAVMMPAKGSVTDDQLKWFVVSALQIVSNISIPVVEVATRGQDPYVAITKTSDLLSVTAGSDRQSGMGEGAFSIGRPGQA